MPHAIYRDPLDMNTRGDNTLNTPILVVVDSHTCMIDDDSTPLL